MGIGITELLIILLIVALLFGTKRLRSAGGDLGAAIGSFRQAMSEPEPQPAGDAAPVAEPAATQTEEISEVPEASPASEAQPSSEGNRSKGKPKPRPRK
jgi:sec-independent protein translocase protein TatA